MTSGGGNFGELNSPECCVVILHVFFQKMFVLFMRSVLSTLFTSHLFLMPFEANAQNYPWESLALIAFTLK
jgi:hypothetical protein